MSIDDWPEAEERTDGRADGGTTTVDSTTTDGDAQLDDTTVDAIANPQRRLLVRYLADRGQDVAASIDAVTDAIAAARTETDDPEVDPRRRRNVAVKLHHVHVPKLKDVGILTHDKSEGTVALTEKGRRVLRHSA